MRAHGARTWIAVGVVVALVAAAVPAWLVLQQRRDRAQLEAAVTAYARAWAAGRFTGVRFAGTDAKTVSTTVTAITAALTPATPDVPVSVQVVRVGQAANDAAVATLAVRWDLGQARSWAYESTLPMKKVDGQWAVAWTPATVHPRLAPGLVLTATRTTAPRGDITGAGGKVLVTSRPVVYVGIQPSRVKNRAQTVADVAKVVDIDTAALTKRLATAKPNDFVDVITLRRSDYDQVRDQLQPIPGTVFRTATLSLGPSPTFARALLGTVGAATKEVVDASAGRIAAGDTTGLSGIQRAYDARLSGVAGVSVKAVPAATTAATNPSTTTAATTAQASVLYDVPAVAGQSVALTIDEAIQEAAESALSAATKPAALVAVRPSTGEVLAVANGGPNAAGYNRAMIGQYPPGSTFKVVTSYALLQGALTPTTPVPCPPSVTVSGKVFTNAENEVLGTVPFSQDFAQSCNTAFVGSAKKITGAQLATAAAALGYGAANTLGVNAFLGSVPRTEDAVEHAADAIGQGKVLASPLTVAGVSAAIAAGRRMPLRLVTSAPTQGVDGGDAGPSPEPATTADAAAGATAATAAASSAAAPSASAPAPVALDAGAVTDVQALMRGVVTSGTGTALQKVPGDPVHGKTGTAEFGNDNPPQTHAWFTGYQGDLAFAVVVEGGGFGAKAAAPLAAAFLTALA